MELPSVPVSITRLSGGNQLGTEGKLLDLPLEVRVTDERGAGVEGVSVSWRLTSGRGEFWRASASNPSRSRPPVPGSVTPTDRNGVAQVYYRWLPCVNDRRTPRLDWLRWTSAGLLRYGEKFIDSSRRVESLRVSSTRIVRRSADTASFQEGMNP